MRTYFTIFNIFTRADAMPGRSRGRHGMINVSPVGRNASIQERIDYEKYDHEHHIRAKFVETLKEKFGDLGLTYVGLSCFH